MDPITQPSTDLSVNDIVDLLGEDEVVDDKIPPKEDDKKPVKVDKEEKEEDEIELKEPEELEDKIEPDEEDLELTLVPRRQEILKEFPELFKKFPGIEKSIYRERKFTELLPTIEDAQEAISARDNFKRFESELFSGKIDSILHAVKNSDNSAYSKIVDDYLPALARSDRQAYIHVLGNVARGFITSMVREAQNTKNEDLQNAALLLNQFAFGTSDFVQGSTFAKPEEKNPEKEKFEQERMHFAEQRITSYVGDLQGKFDNSIKSTIANHIDPKSNMPDYIKKYAIKEAQDDLANLIEQDSRYQALKDKLWEKAAKSNFSKQTVDAIRNAHFAKAKTLLPQVIKKSRIAALSGMGKRASEEKDDESPLPVGKTAAPRKSSNESGKSYGKGNDNPSKGKKTIDFFNED